MMDQTKQIRKLARLCGIQTCYYNFQGKIEHAPISTLISVLNELGVAVNETGSNAHELVPQIQELRRTRFLSPVNVIWVPGKKNIELRFTSSHKNEILKCTFIDESGKTQIWEQKISELSVRKSFHWHHQHITWAELTIPFNLEIGYHQLNIECGNQAYHSHLFVAPLLSYIPENYRNGKQWGFFAPPYALHNQQTWGAGDYSSLSQLSNWAEQKFGTHFIGVLPLLPGFIDREEPDPSPYSAISRLFINEFYIDIEAIPELDLNPHLKGLIASVPFQAKLNQLRQSEYVNYGEVMQVKKQILQDLSRYFFTLPESHPSRQELSAYVASCPEAIKYSEFRAIMDKRKQPWPCWEKPMQNGEYSSVHFRQEDFNYQLFVQWQAHRQLEKFSRGLKEKKCGLYLDLPLGVHPDSYDVWKYTNSFVRGFSAGVPPDPCFQGGQDWGFPPLHPVRMRENGYHYLIKSLHEQMRYADIIRIDHILGFHRIFWIPHGKKSSEGAFVKNKAAEFYAIVNIESHRQKTLVVGEDLGLVPPYIPEYMDRHGLHHLYVMQNSVTEHSHAPLILPPKNSLSSLNTHDMPPFAAWLDKLDVKDQFSLNWVSEAMKNNQINWRNHLIDNWRGYLRQRGFLPWHDNSDINFAISTLKFLAKTPTRFLMLNLEDMWGEVFPQNTPGTYKERPNWLRKFRLSNESIIKNEIISKAIGDIVQAQKD